MNTILKLLMKMTCMIILNTAKLYKKEIKSDKEDKIKPSLTFLKNKAKTLEDIFNNGQYIIVDDVNLK